MSNSQGARIGEWTLGERLRKARKDAGFEDVEVFAEQLGRSARSIYFWERDQRLPRDQIGLIRDWSRVTGFDEAWLAGLVTHREPVNNPAETAKRHGRRKRGKDRRKPLGTPNPVVMNDQSPAEAA